MALQKWKIEAPARRCTVTDKPFEPDEVFTSYLFQEKGGEMRRDDVCEAALAEFDQTHGVHAFSQWKSRYKRGTTVEEEEENAARIQAEGEGAEDALRRLCEDDEPHTHHSRYVLAVFLERKKRLKQVDRKSPGAAAKSGLAMEPEPLIIYEHRKTGEVFVIAEPEMDMERLEQARLELAEYLG